MDMAPGSGSPWKKKVLREKPEALSKGEEAGTFVLRVSQLTPIAARAQTTIYSLQHRAFRDRER